MSEIKLEVPVMGLQEFDSGNITIAEWLKKEGDDVEEGEVVFLLEDDKVAVEVASSANGRLEKIIFPAGSFVQVGSVVGLVSESLVPKKSLEMLAKEISNLKLQLEEKEAEYATRQKRQVRKYQDLQEPFHDDFQELDSMIGLTSVKAEVKKFADLMEVRVLREAAGLPNPDSSLHLVFTGNPGTGKTTVAKTIGGIYQSLGLLSSGHIVTVERKDLIGRYLGESAIKTSEKIEEALDGVLFIDEAYSLISDPNHPIDYAHEVISTLLSGMEENRDRLAVIVAGYKNRMPEFINSNPGLKSRFSREIDFPDYEPEDLTKIFEKFANDSQYKLVDETLPVLKEHFEVVHAMRGENFGNGRIVRNFFEAVIERQATRILNEGKKDKNSLIQITFDDLAL